MAGPVPIGVPRVRCHPPAPGRGISVAVIEPAMGRPRRVVLALMGFAGWLDPFEVQRFQLLADHLGARVVVPETPGCSRARSRLSGPAAAGLLTGNFGRLADTMLTTARPHLAADPLPLHVMGYSLGASVAAAIFASGGTAPIRTITLVEPVAICRRSPIRLLRDTQVEDAKTQTYLACNDTRPAAVRPSADDPHGPRPAVSCVSMLLEGNALRHPRLQHDLCDGLRVHPRASVVLAHGVDSHLSPTADCRRLLNALPATSRQVYDLPLPGGHSLWHSLDAVADLASELVDWWRRAA